MVEYRLYLPSKEILAPPAFRMRRRVQFFFIICQLLQTEFKSFRQTVGRIIGKSCFGFHRHSPHWIHSSPPGSDKFR